MKITSLSNDAARTLMGIISLKDLIMHRIDLTRPTKQKKKIRCECERKPLMNNNLFLSINGP